MSPFEQVGCRLKVKWEWRSVRGLFAMNRVKEHPSTLRMSLVSTILFTNDTDVCYCRKGNKNLICEGAGLTIILSKVSHD